VFSLNVNKTIQSGEGGVCVTNNENLAYRLQLIRNHGEAVVGPAGTENIINLAGFNYRMTETSAAIARVQLQKLPELNERRLDLVQQLKNGLKVYDFFRPLNGPSYVDNDKDCSLSTYYVFPIRFFSKLIGLSRENFINILNCEGMQFYQGYTRPLYLQPVYQKKTLYKNGYPFSAPENKDCKQNYNEGLCPNAERLYFNEMVINEHIRPPHKKEDIRDIIFAIEKVLKA
jgi:dTDP-4-amino-4,6-dideoxygalactose transaminase